MIPAARRLHARFPVEGLRSQPQPQTNLVVTGMQAGGSRQALPGDIDTPPLRRY